MTKNKIYQKYENKLLREKKLSEVDIKMLKSYLPNRGVGRRTSMDIYDLTRLRCIISAPDTEFQLTEEHTRKGLEYLQRVLFKKNGERRNTQKLEAVTDGFFDVVRDFGRFTFVGFNSYYNSPIYRIYNKNETLVTAYYMDIDLNIIECHP